MNSIIIYNLAIIHDHAYDYEADVDSSNASINIINNLNFSVSSAETRKSAMNDFELKFYFNLTAKAFLNFRFIKSFSV